MAEDNSSVIYRSLYRGDFDAGDFLKRMSELFSNVVTSESWIRSGQRIPAGFRDTISSYRLLGRHLPRLGEGRVDFLQLKLKPGVSLESAEKDSLDFLKGYMPSEHSDAVFAAVTSSAEGLCLLLFMRSPALKGITIPAEILDFLCTEGIKNYLHKSCALSRAALDGYFSRGLVLFDDTVIARDAVKIDAALASISFCDVAAGGGEIVMAFIEKLASAREGLNKYIGAGDRDRERFVREFIRDSLYLTDCNAAAPDIIRAALKLRYNGVETDDEHFVWGSLLIDRIFVDRKFDLIISNPPHMRGEQFFPIKELLCGYSSARFGADLYCYYVEKAASMLSELGSAVMLLSNRWMKSKYGEGLREFFIYNPPSKIVDLGSVPQLTGSATPLSVISFYREPLRDGKLRYMEADLSDNMEALSESEAKIFAKEKLTASPWNFSADESGEFVRKLREKSLPLSLYSDGKIYRGILTGLNEAFVVDAERALELSEGEPQTEKLLAPFYSGRDVKRYHLPPVKKYLIFIPKGYTDRMRRLEDAPQWFAGTHRRLASHLAAYEGKAAKRRDRGDYWWELRACGYRDVFEGAKIVLPSIAKRLSAVLVKERAYFNDKCCVIAGGDSFLLALLNSRLMDYIFRSLSSPLLNGYYELRPSVLAQLPIMDGAAESQPRRRLKEEIAAAGESLSRIFRDNPPRKYAKAPEEAAAVERALNRAVYRLYDLSPKEINMVENN
ncbi:MAG: TaqI-like C-terminal specificity domain-containing protein [Synergistaceae bacterium]|nr:TaqI-like C-terminal specificity domain-containing protein [Synergistaceae bacterium]